MRRAGLLSAILFSLLPFGCRPKELPPPADLRSVTVAVEKIRGLKFKSPIRVKSTDERAIRSYIDRRIGEEYSPGELDSEKDVLSLLGLIPPSFPYRQTVLSMFSREVAGYYDPKLDTLFLSDRVPPAQIQAVGAHELTHALQDQYFDVERRMKRNRENDDATLALNALVEGEGTLVMAAFAGASVPTKERMQPAVRDLPAFLVETLFFPYVDGAAFVAHLRRDGGWKAVDAAYAKPPVSSEQVLHPGKYVRGDDPPKPVASDRLRLDDPKATVRSTNVMGEFGIRLVMESKYSARRAGDIAEGWGGDRYWLVREESGTSGLAWLTIWDTPRDADEFARAVKEAFPSASVDRSSAEVRVTIGLSGSRFRFF